MKTKLFTIFFALVTSVGTMFAEKIPIGNLYYYLNAEDSTAEVTSCPDYYTGDITIPTVVNYESIDYKVTSIGSSAFAGCPNMTSITIPEGIEKIGYLAFAGCRGLTNIIIPNSVTDITQNAFNNCDGFPVENNIRYADTYAMEAVDKTLSTYSIKEGTRWLGNGVFWSCSNMTSVHLPTSLEYIEYGAFYECSSLASITIPVNVKHIEIYTFYGCSNLKTVTHNAKNCLTGKNGNNVGGSLYGSQVESVTFGNEVERIPNLCCRDMSKLTTITIPNSVKTIGGGAFINCSGLTSMNIPDNVVKIEGSVFYGCTGLSSITIGKGVAVCDASAFRDCTNILSIVWNAVDCEMPQYTLFGTQVESFIFGADVETIPDYCCMNMDKLISINIPGRVKTIGKSAFLGCTGITRMNIPNSVTTIADWAFWGCSNITDLRIGNGMLDIGGFAFNQCSCLKTFTCEAVIPPTCNMGVFYYIDKSIPLYVPAGSEDAYRTAAYWEEFYNIQAIGAESLENVSDKVTNNKILRNGQIYILMPNGQKYSVIGNQIK